MANKINHNLADVSILLTLSNAFGTFIRLLIAVIAVRYLSKQSYSIYLQIMFLLNIIMMVLSFGMPRSIYYFMPRVENKKKFVFHTFLIINSLGFIALTIIILGRTKIDVLFNNSNLATGLYFLALYIFLSSNGQIFGSVLLSNHKGKTVALTRAILSILTFISIMTPLFLHMGLRGMFWGTLIAYVVRYMVTGLLALKNTEGNFSEITHSECFTAQLKYMLPLGLTSLVVIFSSSIDRFIISFFMGIENFALYDRGAMQIPIISSLSITVGAVILPKLVEHYKDKDIDKLLIIWHKSIEKVSLIIFPCFVFLFIFAPQIIILLYTDSFADSVIIFRIYLFNLLTTITIFGNIFNIANKNNLFLYIQIFCALFSAPLCMAMVGIYGNMGPAIAIVIKNIAETLLNILFIKYVLHVKFKAVFPWSFLMNLLLCAILSGMIPFFIEIMFDLNKAALLLICFPIYLLTYYFMTNYFSLIKEEDRQTIFKWTGINRLRKREFHIKAKTEAQK